MDNSAVFDTLAYAKKIKAVGFTDKQLYLINRVILFRTYIYHIHSYKKLNESTIKTRILR